MKKYKLTKKDKEIIAVLNGLLILEESGILQAYHILNGELDRLVTS